FRDPALAHTGSGGTFCTSRRWYVWRIERQSAARHKPLTNGCRALGQPPTVETGDSPLGQLHGPAGWVYWDCYLSPTRRVFKLHRVLPEMEIHEFWITPVAIDSNRQHEQSCQSDIVKVLRWRMNRNPDECRQERNHWKEIIARPT